MMNLKVTLPGTAISTNSLYKRGKAGQVFLAPEAKHYRAVAKGFVEKAMLRSGPYEGGMFSVEVCVHQKFFNNDGTIKNVDLDNSLKNLLDSIFPVLGISDSAVFEIYLIKKHTTGAQKCQVTLKEIPLPRPTRRSSRAVGATTKSSSSSTPAQKSAVRRSRS